MVRGLKLVCLAAAASAPACAGWGLGDFTSGLNGWVEKVKEVLPGGAAPANGTNVTDIGDSLKSKACEKQEELVERSAKELLAKQLKEACAKVGDAAKAAKSKDGSGAVKGCEEEGEEKVAESLEKSKRQVHQQCLDALSGSKSADLQGGLAEFAKKQKDTLVEAATTAIKSAVAEATARITAGSASILNKKLQKKFQAVSDVASDAAPQRSWGANPFAATASLGVAAFALFSWGVIRRSHSASPEVQSADEEMLLDSSLE